MYSFKDIDRLLSAFQNGEIASRQFVMPLDWYKEAKSFKEKNQTYIDMGFASMLGVEMPVEEIKKIASIFSQGISFFKKRSSDRQFETASALCLTAISMYV